MSVYSGTTHIYDAWREYLATGANLKTDSFKIGLCSNVYVPSAAHSVLADITGEVSGNGYARQTLGSVTWDHSGSTATFDFADPVFTATGGSITARYWFIFDDTVLSPLKPLVAYGLLDATPADVITTDGNTLTFNVNAAGLFTISGGG